MTFPKLCDPVWRDEVSERYENTLLPFVQEAEINATRLYGELSSAKDLLSHRISYSGHASMIAGLEVRE